MAASSVVGHWVVRNVTAHPVTWAGAQPTRPARRASAHARPRRSQRANRKTWKPKPAEFAKFMTALGKRYSGTYKDENDGHPVIPRVFVWAIGNEPNQGGWLTPQWEHGRLTSPRLYRSLYFA